jgi:hypothetical protein
MSASLHHQIIPVSDRDAAARYFVDLLTSPRITLTASRPGRR